MSSMNWVEAFLVVYVLITVLWIKGTDAQSSDFWMWVWKVVKFILLCIAWPLGILLIFSFFMSGDRK